MVEKGSTVRVHYKGTLDDGTVFDSSEGRDPLEFTAGVGQVIPGFDNAVADMEVGDTKSIHIPCAEAYGEYREDAIMHQPLDRVPNADQLPIGQTIYFQGPQGQPIPAKVMKIEDGEAWFDFNSELAGKDLNFDLTLVEIVPSASGNGSDSPAPADA